MSSTKGRPTLRDEGTRVAAFVLAVEAAAVGLLVMLATRGLPSRQDLVALVWVTACALTVIESSVRVERWRAQHRAETPHKNLFGPWLIAAALTCHPLTAGLLAAVLYGWTWLRVLRHTTVALHRWLYSAATTVLGTALAALTTSHLPLVDAASATTWITGIAVIILAVGINHLLVGTVILLAHPAATPRRAFGDTAGLAVEAASSSLGVLAAISYTTHPATIGFAVPVVLVLQHTLVLLTQARAQARTDPKTGLANAGWWRELTERELRRAARTGEPVAVLIADLDHFKLLNDTYGHPAGDTTLKAVATALSHDLRSTDVVGRIGGEEFAITLPGATLHHATTTAERLRTRIAALSGILPAAPSQPHVTVSIGIAVSPDHGTTLDPLLHAADTALYTAKHHGRNTTRTAPRGQ